jgi:hypothetical protein
LIKGKYDHFTTDNLGNVYLQKNEELVKYLPTGKLFARYSNLRLGEIGTVDATNPLKILVYYQNYQQIVFLDNQLSPNSDVISLEKMGLEQALLVCAGANNSFWVYDRQNNELLRFNENSKKIASTGNLKQVLQTELNPNFMLEHNNFLYLNSPETGVYVFDIFGSFSKIISLKEMKEFQVTENKLMYYRQGSFCKYDHQLFEESCQKIDQSSDVGQCRAGINKLYIGFRDSIAIIN